MDVISILLLICWIVLLAILVYLFFDFVISFIDWLFRHFF